MSYKV